MNFKSFLTEQDKVKEARAALEDWLRQYQEHDSKVDLPNDFIESKYPHLFDYLAEVFTKAEEIMAKNKGKSVDELELQGYHDEWEDLIKIALKDVL